MTTILPEQTKPAETVSGSEIKPSLPTSIPGAPKKKVSNFDWILYTTGYRF